MNYSETAKSLRQCAEGSCAGCKNDIVQIGCRGMLQNEAADAIEELEKKMLDWQAVADEHWEAYQHWFHNYMNDIPKWISAEERLPEKPGMYLVWLHEPTDFEKDDYEYNCGYVDYFHYDAEQGLWQNEPYAAYNAHIEFVDKVNGFYVSHWMEKPMPPKEET